MASEVGSGTQAATPATEHTLYDNATAGVFELVVDATNLSGAELVELRAYVKVLAAGSYRQAHMVTVAAGDTSPAIISPPLLCPNGVKFTLKQVGGSSRNFDWAVWSA